MGGSSLSCCRPRLQVLFTVSSLFLNLFSSFFFVVVSLSIPICRCSGDSDALIRAHLSVPSTYVTLSSARAVGHSLFADATGRTVTFSPILSHISLMLNLLLKVPMCSVVASVAATQLAFSFGVVDNHDRPATTGGRTSTIFDNLNIPSIFSDSKIMQISRLFQESQTSQEPILVFMEDDRNHLPKNSFSAYSILSIGNQCKSDSQSLTILMVFSNPKLASIRLIGQNFILPGIDQSPSQYHCSSDSGDGAAALYDAVQLWYSLTLNLITGLGPFWRFIHSLLLSFCGPNIWLLYQLSYQNSTCSVGIFGLSVVIWDFGKRPPEILLM